MMNLFSLFGFLLILFHSFNATISEFATPITADIEEDNTGSVESLISEKSFGSLFVNTLENDVSQGMIVRKVQGNLTLSCEYHIFNRKEMPPDHVKLEWVLPNDSLNRSSEIWTAEDGVLWLKVWQMSLSDAGRYVCVDRNNALLVGETHVIITSAFPFCSPSTMFMCWGNNPPPHSFNGPQCILASKLCDGFRDCPNGRDEHVETCFSDDPCRNKLMCADGRCIPKELCCNNGTITKYGYNGHTCIPHPCCSQHYKPLEILGGGWRKKPSTPPLLQMTLYTASFCVLIFLISITCLISIICRARLKRSADIGRAPVTNGPRSDPPAVSPSPRCNYTLVPAACETPTSTYSAVLRRYFGSSIPNTTPPSYSQATADQHHDDAELPSYFEIQSSLEAAEASTIQVRRPTDFGMSTLANAVFNARYRPVPQEIVSFGDASDSDSSCRSPGSHTFNIYPSPSGGRQRVGSPLGRFTENSERIQRSNPFDRILDRFGLNAPYAVGRDPTQNNVLTSPPPIAEDNPNSNSRSQFLSSILGRLRNSFNRNPPTIEMPNSGNTESSNVETNNNNSNQVERRRPDTPDVLELSLDEIDLCRNAVGDTFTLNGRTVHLLGTNNAEDRPEMYSLSLEGFYVVDNIVENLNRFVGRPVSPPPYSEIADVAPSKMMGPPPPYKSRENLNFTNDAQPGPSCNDNNNRNISGLPSGNVMGSNQLQLAVIVESMPGTSGVNSNQTSNTNHQVLMDIVNCRDDSMSSLNLESIESREKDSQNGNTMCKDESVNSLSLLDNGNPVLSSNYSLKLTTSGDVDNNNYDNITSPSCSNVRGNSSSVDESGESGTGTVMGRSDTMNDISNNNGNTRETSIRQLSLNALTAEQNGNVPATTSACGADLIAKSVQRSVFPPISLEFIDSDCVTE